MPPITARSKPVIVTALQYTGGDENLAELDDFVGRIEGEHNSERGRSAFQIYDESDERTAQVYDSIQNSYVHVNMNDYIIKGTKGEFYPCNPDVFHEKYEVIS
jgi:hypothetical protein